MRIDRRQRTESQPHARRLRTRPRQYRCAYRPHRAAARCADVAVPLRHATGPAARTEIRQCRRRRVHTRRSSARLQSQRADSDGRVRRHRQQGAARVQSEYRRQSACAPHRQTRQHLGHQRVLERALEAQRKRRSSDDARQARGERRLERHRVERHVQSADWTSPSTRTTTSTSSRATAARRRRKTARSARHTPMPHGPTAAQSQLVRPSCKARIRGS